MIKIKNKEKIGERLSKNCRTVTTSCILLSPFLVSVAMKQLNFRGG